jgi:tRNA(Arg) A34 adenosine deaminase TadA
VSVLNRPSPLAPLRVVRRQLALAPLLCACAPRLAFATGAEAGMRWAREAEAMRQQALSWGDQAYGAVLVRDDRVIGHGPSRVVKDRNPDAHAEREAIRDALAREGADRVRGADLYSTSRPCALCEAAAARAGVRRMYVGPQAQDAGAPVAR